MTVTDRPTGTRTPRTPRTRRRPSRRRIRARRIALGVALALVLTTSWAVVDALRTPGDDPALVKLAEWARDHNLGPVVTALEAVQYRLDPPKTGGTPDTSLLQAGAASQPSGKASSHVPASVLRHARMTTPVTPALPGEGVFVPQGPQAGGPLVQVTYVRPDTQHTSYLTGVVWISHTARFVLHPGFQDPGPSPAWTQPDKVAPSAYPGLLATFNSGFKIKDAGGGYYDHGHLAGTLADGAASLVIYKDGHATVGSWGAGVRMTPDVAFVRQNLQLLVDGGAVVPNLDANVESNWGATLGGAFSVWRSGIGVTAKGDIVYAMGDAMSVADLADVLHRAGAVEAMQLDINKAWVSFMYYDHTAAGLVPHKVGAFERPVDRYLGDTSRDFVAVYAP